jgi:glycolate oxidase iron-sulfur subunit
MGIEKHYDEIARCNRCGFCQVACPIFRATGHEAGVARGRIALLRALIEGRLRWDQELEEPLFACLLCGACTSNCFPAVPTADLILDARSEYLDRVGRRPPLRGGARLHTLLFEHLLPYPGRLRLAARAAALGKRSGLSKVARALGLLRIFGRDFPRAQEIVEHFPERAFREKVKPGVVEGRGERRIGYFIGCGTDIMCPQAAEATLRILRELGKTVSVLENCCCGLPAACYGDRTAAVRLAEKNLRLLADGRFDLVVTDCSSCAAFLKKYPTLFAEDDTRHAVAKTFAAAVRDLPEVIGSAGKGDRHLLCEAPEGPFRQKVPVTFSDKLIATYHDPCHASRGQGLVEQPRKILRSIPGLEYRELPEADWCCGGAGSYALSHYELSRKVLGRKIDNVEKTGANLLVTSCPACIIHLSYGVRQRGLPVRVCHISELISASD